MSKSVTLLPSTRPFPAIDFEYSIHRPNTRLLQELRRIFPDVDASMNVVLLFQRSSEDMSAYCRETVLEKDRLFQNVCLIVDNKSSALGVFSDSAVGTSLDTNHSRITDAKRI
jgi:hypothetical protein